MDLIQRVLVSTMRAEERLGRGRILDLAGELSGVGAAAESHISKIVSMYQCCGLMLGLHDRPERCLLGVNM